MDLREAIRRDAEAPQRNLKAVASSVTDGPGRLDALGGLLQEHPDDPVAAELYLRELFARKARQVGSRICLAKTFLSHVDAMDPETRAALPATFEALVKLVRQKPVPLEDPRLLAHALMLNGHTSAWLKRAVYGGWREVLGVPDGGYESAKRAYRRLRRRHHPDSGGDAETFHHVQRAWRQAREELHGEETTATRAARKSRQEQGAGALSPGDSAGTPAAAAR